MPELKAIAWSVGSRLVGRGLEDWPDPVASGPVTIQAPEGGYIVLFRFGAIAAVGLPREKERALLDRVRTLATDPRPEPVSEEARVLVREDADEGVDAHGDIVLREWTVERTQILATVLAKSAVLSEHEGEIASVFDRIEPFAQELRSARLPRRGRTLLRELADVLLIQSRMIGRAEVGEKPEMTWEDPQLDRLYGRLSAEYELVDRQKSIARKVDAISKATGTYLGLLNDRRILRVEWYIVLLILVEIVLIVYEIFGVG